MPNYNIGNNPNENSPSQGLFTDGGLPVVQKGTGGHIARRVELAPHEERTPENQRYFKPDMDIYNKNPAFRREAHDALKALLEKQGMPEGELSDVDLGLALSAFDAAYLVLMNAMEHNAEQVRENPFQPVGSLRELEIALRQRLGRDDASYYIPLIAEVRGSYAGVSGRARELSKQLKIALGNNEKGTPVELPVQRRSRVLGLLSFLGDLVSSGKGRAASAPASEQLTELYRMFDRTIGELIAAHEERNRLSANTTDLEAELERLGEENARLRHEAEVTDVAGLLLDGRIGIEPTYGQSGVNRNLIGTKQAYGNTGADSIEPV